MNAVTIRKSPTRSPIAPRPHRVPIDVAQLEAKILGRLAGMRWYTLVIDAQQWKRVAERARELGYETYAPMLREPGKLTPRHRTARIAERLALGGYLFVDMPGPERRFDLFIPEPTDSVGAVRGCRGFITLDGSPVALHAAVIAGVRQREAAGEFDLTGLSENGRFLIPKWVKRGVKVELIGADNPMAGFFGEIERIEKKLIKVAVDVLGGITSIWVPMDWLRWVGP